MIHYDAQTMASIPDGFKGLPNTHPSRPDIFEIEPIVRHLTESDIIDNDFYGFLSPRFFEKTGLTASDVTGISQQELSKFDIASFSPGPLYLSDFLNPVTHAEKMHGDFTMRFKHFVSSIDKNNSLKCEEFVEARVPQRFFLLSHYILARGSFWKTWAKYISLFIEAEASNQKLKLLLDSPCQYPGRSGIYTYTIFILERLAGLIAFSRELKIYEACFLKRCLFDFERSNPWPRWIIHLAKPLFYFEEKFHGNGYIPIKSIDTLTLLRNEYIKLDRLVSKGSLRK
ncbi:MAG: hypothetical protein FIB06_06380 [Betaproteobacteria bacterium]|nr:hypothetical protein [Betaproteobacteria bacterium]